MEKILITGALGQLGTDLLEGLIDRYGSQQIVATDLKPSTRDLEVDFEELDVLDEDHLEKIIQKHGVTQIYHLAAILSARAESKPLMAWDINMSGLFNILEAGRIHKLKKIFWPSSIAVFGPDTPKTQTAQNTITNPSTIYGIQKLAGERWCEYYFQKYGLDIRSLRYPGLIGYKSMAGGGTTDYAVDIYFSAARGDKFSCFLEKNTRLPMLYMKDAVRGTIELMEAESSCITVRSSYNLSGISFTPQEIYNAIQKEIPDFEINYNPDFRQEIADSWPDSIDDIKAKEDWNWSPKFDLESMTSDILSHIRERIGS